MADFEPLLQIVHISDLHVIAPGTVAAKSVGALVRVLRRMSASIARYASDGMAPHDPLAPALFCDFLQKLSKDPIWSKVPTWLVNTGDDSSLGDRLSIQQSRRHIADFVAACGVNDVSIYGNHDAWPGMLPVLAPPGAVQSQVQFLTGAGYPIGSALNPLRQPLPNSLGEVQLYTIDSIIRDYWQNTFARGEVPHPLEEALVNLIGNKRVPDPARSFRILSVHHPVHYPPPRPGYSMVMKNDSKVGQELSNPGPGKVSPSVHLVLSGHTHFLFPAHGSLPLQVSLCDHPELGSEQCQFVVGSLMQLDKYGKRLGWPHQCQILRLYFNESQPDRLLLERLLVARASGERYRGTGIGPYLFVPLPQSESGGPVSYGEEITFAI